MRETRPRRARTLRVLLVEDSENDAKLLLRELRRGGYQPRFRRVFTPEGMEEALRGAEGEPFQVVISDYYMPRFGAPEALELLRGLGQDIPFIVVSGKVGEDAAVEVMKAGADDYLTKENMSRLCPAIDRELREAEARREREEALGQSEALYRTVVEQAAENIFLVDPRSGRVLEANDALLLSLGYTEDELKEMTLYDIVAHDRESVDRNIGRVMERGTAHLGERQYRRKDGSLADVEVNVSAVPYDGERVMCIVAHDVTERKRAEAMLEEIREAERNRIARELHDGTLQDIVYALQEIQIMQVVAEDGGPPALEDTAEALRRSVEGLRGAIFELRLKEALGGSLVSSLENLVDLNRRMARGRYDLKLVVGDDFPAAVPDRAGQEIMRLVQEALTNVRRHAEAGHARVELGLDGDLAYVEVSDDGRGFDVKGEWTGMGRQSMNHRALELGGELCVRSAPGEGTRVRLRVPVSRLIQG